MANEKKNLVELKSHLENGEEIESHIFGAYQAKIMNNDSVRNGVLVATETRIIFYAKKMFGYDMEVFPYLNISSIEVSKDFMGHKISFFATGNKVTVKWIHSKNIMEFVTLVRDRIGKKHEPSIIAKETTSEKSPIEKIKELKELLDIGIITQEEFDAKKKQLLEMI
ncbi:PH domain-containing protein [Clostridium frigoris]|nr:PH domain-containing protein [Clostridium frigoris]